MSAPIGHDVVATLELEPRSELNVRALGLAAQGRLFVTLRREPRRWRVDVASRRDDETASRAERSIVADTLGDLRRAVEAELGDTTWRALLQVAGPALEVMAPDIMRTPSPTSSV